MSVGGFYPELFLGRGPCLSGVTHILTNITVSLYVLFLLTGDFCYLDGVLLTGLGRRWTLVGLLTIYMTSFRGSTGLFSSFLNTLSTGRTYNCRVFLNGNFFVNFLRGLYILWYLASRFEQYVLGTCSSTILVGDVYFFCGNVLTS